MSRSVEDISAAAAEVVGDAIDDVEFAELVDRIKLAEETKGSLTDEDLAPVAVIEDRDGAEITVYRDGFYVTTRGGLVV